MDLKAKSLDVLDEYELQAEEDAPMTLAFDPQVRSLAFTGFGPRQLSLYHLYFGAPQSKQLAAGINSAPAQLKTGVNDHCRVFNLTEENK